MTVSFDAQSTASTTGAAATSFSNSTNLTVGSGTNRALLVCIAWSTSTPPTGINLTWNGVALTQLIIHSASSGSTAAIYGLLNPASGANTLAGSWTGARDFYVDGISFNGVDQTSTAVAFLTNFATGTSINAGLITNTPIGDGLLLLVGVAANIANMTSGTTPGTQVFLDNTQASFSSGAVWAPGIGGNEGLSSLNTSAAWVAVRARIVAAPPVADPTIKPRETVLSKLFQWAHAPAFQPYNQVLYSVVSQLQVREDLIMLPYSVRPFRPDASRPLNLNLFTNPFPFGSYNWPPAITLEGKSGDLIQPWQNFYSVTVQAPFIPVDWSKPFEFPQLPPQATAYNINLFTNPIPFGPFDYSEGAFRVPPVRPDTTSPFNPNIYTNPIPFAQYMWTDPVVIGPPPPQATPYNINVFTNLLPFGPFDWNKAVQLPPERPAPSRGLNINIFTNPVPFLNVDTSRPVRLTNYPISFPYNPSIYAETVTVEFRTPYFGRPTPVRPVLSDVTPYNLNLYSVVTVPFNQTDWARPFVRAKVSQEVTQPYNVNLYGVVVVQYQDRGTLVMRPYPLRPALSDATRPTNPNLFTNPVPIFNFNATVSSTIEGFSTPAQPYNVNLYGVVTVQPFAQYDWSVARVPRPQQVTTSFYNQSLYTVTVVGPSGRPRAPFVMRPHPLSPALSDATQSSNFNLFVTIQTPFAQYDWSKPFVSRPVLSVPAQGQALNPNLFTNPFPFNQNQYPNSRPVKIGLFPLPPYNQNLYTVTPAPGQTEHIVKFIGNMGNFMIR